MYKPTFGWPSVSILIPYFNRKRFEKLIQYNLEQQSYPNICEVIIADDSDQPGQRLQLDLSCTITYMCLARCTIGHKRNVLKSRAHGDICVHMDSDDCYAPGYVATVVRTLLNHPKGKVTGSSDMLFVNPLTGYRGYQSCIYMNQINEASQAYWSEYGRTHFFLDQSHAENGSFVPDVSIIVDCPIHDIMVCTIHGTNTIDKSPWEAPQYANKLPMWFYRGQYLTLLKNIELRTAGTPNGELSKQ